MTYCCGKEDWFLLGCNCWEGWISISVKKRKKILNLIKKEISRERRLSKSALTFFVENKKAHWFHDITTILFYLMLKEDIHTKIHGWRDDWIKFADVLRKKEELFSSLFGFLFRQFTKSYIAAAEGKGNERKISLRKDYFSISP